MAKTAPSEEELRAEFTAGVAAKSQKWFKKTMAAQGVIAAASSAQAEQAYINAMQQVLGAQLRLKGLAKVSDADVKAGVQAVGAGGFSTGASAKAGKFAKRAKSYVDLAVSVANSLQPRTADAATNVSQRVTPIAVALQAKKRGGT